MLLTFTRRASDEMLRRARRALGETGSRTLGTVWGGTFHSVANRLLRTYGEAIGLDPDFTVMDQSDAEDLMDASRHDHALGSKEKRFPRKQTCLSIYSRCVNSPDRLDHTHERFDHVLVDEYQDTNRLQSAILHRMRALNRNLPVVGEDAQSIYSFRAAEVRNLLDFPVEFPGATVVTLETDYRSTQLAIQPGMTHETRPPLAGRPSHLLFCN